MAGWIHEYRRCPISVPRPGQRKPRPFRGTVHRTKIEIRTIPSRAIAYSKCRASNSRRADVLIDEVICRDLEMKETSLAGPDEPLESTHSPPPKDIRNQRGVIIALLSKPPCRSSLAIPLMVSHSKAPPHVAKNFA
ncbi:hypothetical protein EVAR_84397_1 [Eumeta japonica]|uniref:Uncharacterized protein n=1 Tax=Eumeta variegata TaxID=151549 RepID=A0A4C1YJ29_EUMVA|nr:hypothetical protein EVAR_84397_1 [Eumeta japonica]